MKSELGSCEKVFAAVLGSPSLMVHAVSVDVWYGLCSTSHSESPKISNLMFQLCSKLYYACLLYTSDAADER